MADLPPLGSAASALLAEERAFAPASVARDVAVDAMKSRVRERVEASLLAGAGLGAGAGAGALLAGTGEGASSTRSRVGKIARLVVGGALLAGGGFALGRYTSPATSATPVTTEAVVTAGTTPVIAPPTIVAAQIASLAIASPAPPSVTSNAPAVRSAPSDSTTDRALAKEGALVDRARRALQAGRPRDALDAIREHRALTHDAGQLAEERDVLEVHALARDGQIAAARAAVVRFRQRHPSSAFASSLDDAVTAEDTNAR